MRRASAAAIILLFAVSSLTIVLSPQATADPGITDNLDGTSTAVWDFSTPADYTLSNAFLSGGVASLAQQSGWWNSTTVADFSGPDGSTNVTWTSWPGDVALSETSGPPSLLTLQPDGTGEDTWLDRANPTLNHGGDTTLVLDGRNPESRPVLRFDFSSVPANALIDDATLSLYQSAGVNNNVNARLRLITASWAENQANWNDRLTGTPWAAAGGDYNGKIVDQQTLDNTVGWRNWNATVLADLWYRNRVPNYGLILEAPNPGGNADKTFFSSDYAVDPTLRPRLSIRYRILGINGEYISKIGGDGNPANWQTISWNLTDRSLLTDEFNGASLDPMWTWTNPPPSYDVGTTTPGHLHVVSSTGVDIIGATFSGNVLANEVVGNFTATMKFTANPSLNGQKTGLMALLGPRDWYNVGTQYVSASATVNWRVRSTVDSVTTTRVDVNSGNPNPAWVRIQRTANTLTAYTSPDGTAWTLQDTYTPTFEFPLQIRLAYYAADGTSGTALVTDVDYIRVVHDSDSTATVHTRTGNVSPVDGTWTGWSTPYPSPAGSTIGDASRYIEFRLGFGVTYPDHTPNIGDVNVSWVRYAATGTVETNDLIPADLSTWGTFSVVQVPNGQTTMFEYSLNSGGSWNPVAPPADLSGASPSGGRIQFRATLTTSDPLVTPSITEIRITYAHRLDHFYVTASPAAGAGALFSITVTAKDAGNATMSGWTGAVTVATRLVDGITPGGGILGTTSLTIVSGGTATLSTETYTKAETIRIYASYLAATGLSGSVIVSPGPLAQIVVSPGNVSLRVADTQNFAAQGVDSWNNPVSSPIFTWNVLGDVGTLNGSSGAAVTFTAGPPPANGSVEATSGTVTGVAQIHVAAGYPPVLAVPLPVVIFDEDIVDMNALAGPLTAHFSDADGEPLGFSVFDARNLSFRINADRTLDLWGPANWSGSEDLRLRATDPSGAFVESVLSVLVRPINDAPVLAPIPDLRIDSGNSYALDLAPYITDIDTSLSSITVTTDSPYVSVSGHVLTISLPGDRPQAEFNVTVSDGAAMGSRAVKVTLVPAWWQGTYLLAIPPIGLFVVVAMFAQRARWRPAKAFLVDERGRMLREFTLDPSCRVTYDQVVEAGVLEAVDKPIKVLKYQGQTVRGDALAVVLLAYGPVTLEQVEFAREMLVQVQDKFEDAVKQRLEEARARERELETQAKDIDERRIGIEARTGELNTIQEEIGRSRSKISADEAAIAARDEDLKRRESQLADERNAIDDLAKQLEAMRAGFDSRNAQIEGGEARLAERASAIDARETEFEALEARLNERAQGIANEEARLAPEGERLAREASAIDVQGREQESREATIRRDTEELAQGRQQFETEQKDLLEFKRSVDARVSNVEKAEAEAAAKAEDLKVREERLAPFEGELAVRAAMVVTSEERVRDERSRAEAALRELTDRTTDLGSRETALKEDRVVLEEARAAFDSDRREFQDRIRRFEEEFQRRRGEVDAQVKGLEEQQLRLAQEKESFGLSRSEKNQAILSKEIEVEAREQSLLDKEDAVRSQAEENARRLAELAGREETLEVEGAKLDKARAELDARRSELTNLAKELDGKAARLREEEARRADELRTWQTTLESQQALHKEQRDTFEAEAVSVRESWADRVMRLERREIEVKDQEEKVREDVELVARNREELIHREQAAQEALQSGSEMKAEAEHLKTELEQRTLEIDSKERGLREEAAGQAVELEKRTESLNALEAEIGAKRGELENERAGQAERIHQTDMDLQKTAQLLDAKGRELVDREGRIAATQESLRSDGYRLEEERAAVQDTGKQLEAHQLELAQLRDRYESESARVRTEAETMRQSLAVKEAEIQAEGERIERDASALQDTLGAKAKEMAIREKSLAAREGDLRTQEEDFEARTRELESKERQAEARLTEMSAQAMALVSREGDMNARVSQFDETVRKFESEEGEKRRQWETLQTAFRTQQAQLSATAETRAAETSKRAEDVEGREGALRAATTQLELERSKHQAEAKAQSAKSAEAGAAWRRSEARLVELKTMEDEILRARQSFESERSAWSTKRAEELKQLEATRDAAAVQAQQAERLVSESQRRALIAEEAEKASKRSAADLAAQQTAVERRRSEADKAERNTQAQLAQLQESSRKLAAKETEVAAMARDVEVRLAKLVASEKETATAAAELRTRRGSMDQESTRLASLTDQLATRQKDLESRASALEAKLSQVAKREQTLATELQRADDLMEDLTRKEGDILSRGEAARALESDLRRQEAALAARDAQLGEGQRNLDKMRQEIGMQRTRMEEDLRTASTSRGEAEKLRVQAEAMQAEVSKNLRFLQKKALDVLDREEKLREREVAIEHKERALDTRAEILEGKERTNEVDRSEFESKTTRLQAEVDRLRGRIAEIEKGAGPSTAAMEDWKKDVENRVKIIQKKAMDLLDREQKLREKEAELRALAEQLGGTP